MRAAIVIPTYNEKENIIPLLRSILSQKVAAALEIIVVDDNSPDGTGLLIDEESKLHQEISCIHRKGKLGLGSAYREGFRTALSRGADAIVGMDADFSHSPKYLPALLAGTAHADLVIGSRYIKGGGQKGCSLGRRILSRGANALARLLLALPTRDATSGFRCYTRAVFDRIDLSTVRSDGYSFLVEMVVRCRRAGLTIREVPIIFENRTRGASKISRREVWHGMMTILHLLFRRF